MCGRYALTLPPDAVAKLFDATPGDGLPPPSFNICPTQTIAVLVAHDGARHLVPMRWGFVPRWYKTPSDGPLLINARAESIADKPAFREACRTRRCVVPATGFFEWAGTRQTGKTPWFIRPRDAAPMLMGGIRQTWQDGQGARLVTCAIVTVAANATLATIHHRMPLIVPPDALPLWLGEAGSGAASLMVPAPDDALAAYRVSTRVNAASANDPDLIEAI